MTSTVMLAAVRTILDEASASFWTDAEIYAALADAQNNIIDKVLAVYRAKRMINPDMPMPYTLESLTALVTGTGLAASYISVPSDYLEMVYAKWDSDSTGTQYRCEVMSATYNNFREDNTFLSATHTKPICQASPITTGSTVLINFLPVYKVAATYEVQYIATPTDIAAGQNAKLPANTHNAMIHFAVARMLDKDQRLQEAQMHQQIYLQELQTVS